MSNVISSNNSEGVAIFSGFDIIGATATGNLIEGNFIGTDITGTAALGNIHGPGILIQESADTSVVGNVISSNGSSGVHIEGIDATGNVVQDNFIGTDITGTAALGNRGAGVLVLGALNTIGGTNIHQGNTIAFNGDQGVSVSAGTGNAILSNAIFSNELLGIALGEPSRVTPNDTGDRDTGANTLQNFPVLTSAAAADSTIAGTLNSTATTMFRLEFFANAACDPSGHGEGETFLGATTVTTDGAGDVRFTATLPGTVRAGQFLTATATDPGGNTSGFSACIQPIRSVRLDAGWNLIGWTGATPVTEATASITGQFTSLFTWDAGAQAFRSFRPGLHPVFNSLQELSFGDGVWILVSDPNGADWTQPAFADERAVELQPGFNLALWTGPDGMAIADAVAGLGNALSVLFIWDAASQAFLSFNPRLPARLNSATTIGFGDGVWVRVTEAVTWEQAALSTAESTP